MINIMSGTTAVKLTPSNVAAKSAKGANTNANVKNKAESGSENINTPQNNSKAVNMQVQNTQNNQQNNTANSTFSQVAEANTKSVDYSKDAIAALQKAIRKEHLQRNYYIDEATNVPVLQIVNKETDRVIGQYPADMYLNLIMKVRENQKSMVEQNLQVENQPVQQSTVDKMLFANQKS